MTISCLRFRGVLPFRYRWLTLLAFNVLETISRNPVNWLNINTLFPPEMISPTRSVNAVIFDGSSFQFFRTIGMAHAASRSRVIAARALTLTLPAVSNFDFASSLMVSYTTLSAGVRSMRRVISVFSGSSSMTSAFVLRSMNGWIIRFSCDLRSLSLYCSIGIMNFVEIGRAHV